MKKILAQTISFMLIIANLTACNSQPPESLSGTSNTIPNTDETQNSTINNTDNGSNAEAQKPAGEPTFLIFPYGLPSDS